MNECDRPLPPHARQGLILFNKKKYFEAHEELEAAWREEKGGIRDLYQGILEAGVTYLHITRGNYAGAIKVYGRSMRWLRMWPEACCGVEVGQLRNDLSTAIEEVRRLGEKQIREFNPDLLKPVLWKEDQDER
ncbi:MAG TPA: DUF309 domain-containing protein [Anaerolineales bacterium]|nr:DUF309 domain-containing protein [Anaerolineales bacterium]